MDKIKEAYEEAVKVLEKCATPHGFHAAYPGYDAVWARDSVITSMGASLLGDKFKETFKQSLITLANHQSEKGQIPNAVDIFSKRKPHVDFQSIDSTLWFVIGHYLFKERYDGFLFSKHKTNIDRAIEWLSYQDMGEDGMPEQLPTTDWQDAFPHRYGHTINTQALYYKVLELSNQKYKIKKLSSSVNDFSDLKLWNGKFYLPWRWKNHNKYQEKGEWFDSLGNLLSIIFGLADKSKSEKILAYIKNEKIDEPYPIKAIYPPISQNSKDWQDYFLDCNARKAYHYLNAGIWTYIGGFYVLALIKQRKFEEAQLQLNRLAEANLNSNFAEWLDGRSGKSGASHSGGNEGNQAWNAGMYILAYCSLEKKKVLI
ncbi:MAG: glycoside hydrolase 100 family protein [Nanoarchaeota archaeon]